MNKAVFLDRDGTIIRHIDLMHKGEHLYLLPGVAKAIRILNKLGFLIVVITNQPVISRDLITEKGVREIHTILVKRLATLGARIDAVYFCPHHPNAKSKKYGIKCTCRKPEPGMILKAIKKFNINPKRSFMIGDAIIDCVAGERAGVKTILVKTGPGHKRLDEKYPNVKPNYTAKNLTKAIKYINSRSGAKSNSTRHKIPQGLNQPENFLPHGQSIF